MNTIFNLDAVETKEGNYIDKEGTYTLVVKSLDVTEGDTDKPTKHSFVCESEDGETIRLNLYLTEKALWKYKLFLKALGHPAEGIVDLDKVSKGCIGKKFIGVVKRAKPRINIVTNELEESKYFEIVKFEKC